MLATLAIALSTSASAAIPVEDFSAPVGFAVETPSGKTRILRPWEFRQAESDGLEMNPLAAGFVIDGEPAMFMDPEDFEIDAIRQSTARWEILPALDGDGFHVVIPDAGQIVGLVFENDDHELDIATEDEMTFGEHDNVVWVPVQGDVRGVMVENDEGEREIWVHTMSTWDAVALMDLAREITFEAP